MTPPSRPKDRRLAVVVGVCIVGLLLVPLAEHPAMASPELVPPAHQDQVNLRLDGVGATRVLAADIGGTGAAQEEDPQNPKPMDQQTEPQVVKRPAGSSEKIEKAPAPDRFAFVKDWPFWVIVGGVLVAGVVGIIVLKNSNQKTPCEPQFNAGCFGAQ